MFTNNLKVIERHNATNASWTMAVNRFADLTLDEFSARNGAVPVAMPRAWGDARKVAVDERGDGATVAVPPVVDCQWRAVGAVTPVKNQQQCGSCWAFATIATLESAWFLARGSLQSLSEQQLVDCCGTVDSDAYHGCAGGTVALWCVQSLCGSCTEDAYPYTASAGACRACPAVATVSGVQTTPATLRSSIVALVSDMQQAVSAQPVAVFVGASSHDFQFYSGQCQCVLQSCALLSSPLLSSFLLCSPDESTPSALLTPVLSPPLVSHPLQV